MGNFCSCIIVVDFISYNATKSILWVYKFF